MRHATKIRLFEFFIVGLLFGIIEDLIAIMLATEGYFKWRYVAVAAVVALPFAYISEVIVDHPNFWKKILPKHWFSEK